MQYVGRYHARIPCTDHLLVVKDEKEAEYILNLLEDGSAIGPIPVLGVWVKIAQKVQK
jgi:hypothetical protein